MTRIEVDRGRCIGSGTCEAMAPDVFEIDDGGVLAVRRPAPADDEVGDVELAVRACPTQALALVD